jgi:S-(hydroxymethyl)glutathione dehydrogenase / alcohol dehydrogenase
MRAAVLRLPHSTPAVVGHEGAGIVTAVGRDVSHVNVGDHVILAWTAPYGRCVDCVARHAPQL